MPKPTGSKHPDELPSVAEFGQMIANLARLGAGGALVSDLARTKTRRQNADLLRAKLRALPKAK